MKSIPAEVCSDVLEEAAGFFDRHRRIGCHFLEITWPAENDSLQLEIGFVTDPGFVGESIADFIPPVAFSEATLIWSIMRSKSPLRMDRPHAAFAIRALRSVAEELPLDIKAARGFLLDNPSIFAPQLELDCPVDVTAIDDLSEFLRVREHARDGVGAPTVQTDFVNHYGQPIGVRLNLMSPI